MKITIKMPTGDYMTDSDNVKILDEDQKPVPILEDKEFTAPFIPSRMLKRTIVIGNSISEHKESEESFDTMAMYVSEIYGRQFSVDNILDGLSSLDLIKEFTNCITAVTGDLNIKSLALSASNPNV